MTLTPARYRQLIDASVRELNLDLRGATVLTEAASGAYVVTPVIAAAAGAHVMAVTRTTQYGAQEDIYSTTMELASLAGVADRISIRTAKSPEMFAAADIVTNSGHLRPIDGCAIGAMKATAVISLMYESWEFRPADVYLDACRARGIPVAGVNERHPAIDVFSYLGMMAVRLLHDAGIAVYRSNIALLCDNDFGPYIRKGLEGAGAFVSTSVTAGSDAVLVAVTPRDGPVLSVAEIEGIAKICPAAVMVQFWGDLDHPRVAEVGLAVWPQEPPRPGHMGILPSAIGPEPVVRLQAGGLKVGEVLWRARRAGNDGPAVARILEHSGFGQVL